MAGTLAPDLRWLWPHYKALRTDARHMARRWGRSDLAEDIVDDVLKRAERLDFDPARAQPRMVLRKLVRCSGIDVVKRRAENSKRARHVDAVQAAGAFDPGPRILAALDLERQVPRIPARKRRSILSQLGSAPARQNSNFNWVPVVLLVAALAFLLLKAWPHLPIFSSIAPQTDSKP